MKTNRHGPSSGGPYLCSPHNVRALTSTINLAEAGGLQAGPHGRRDLHRAHQLIRVTGVEEPTSLTTKTAKRTSTGRTTQAVDLRREDHHNQTSSSHGTA